MKFKDSDVMALKVSFLLYFLSGGVGAGLLFNILIWGIWGRATSWDELTAFLGSLTLFVTAFGSLINPRRAARYALFGSIAQWVWFGPSANWIVRELLVGELASNPLFPVYLVSAALILLSAVNSLYVINLESGGEFIRVRMLWVNIAAILFLGVLALVPIHQRSFPQVIEVVVAQWMPSAQTLTVIEPAPLHGRFLISADELAQLRALGLTGELSVRHGEIYGKGERKARMLIVMQPFLDSVVELAQPNATSVLYVQKDGRWMILPPTTPLLQRLLRIVPRKEETTMVEVYNADGGGVGLPIHWRLPCTGHSC